MQLFPRWYSVFCILATMFSQNSHSLLSTEKNRWPPFVFLLLACDLETLKEVNGGDFRSHLFISPILGITLLHFFFFFVFFVWGPVSCKVLFPFISVYIGHLSWEDKSGPDYSILAVSESLSDLFFLRVCIAFWYNTKFTKILVIYLLE